jgi:hypothetical protein
MTGHTIVKNDIKGSGNILDIQEVTSVGSVSVNGQGDVPRKLVNKFGNQFLRELVRSIHIVSTSDQTGEFETPEIRLDKELSPSFGCRIGVGWLQDVLFRHGVSVKVFSFSINLISGDVDKSFDGITHLGTLQEHVSSKNVGLGESNGVSKRVVYVCLSGKVQDSVDFLLFQHIADKIQGTNVSLDESEVGQLFDTVKILKASTIVQAIVDNNIVLGVLFAKKNGHVGGNETFGREAIA